jgi:septal ring factor EnvC (AmiA/AmiB activator)
MKPDTSISGLGEIKTFPQGSSAVEAVPAQTLVEEFLKLRTAREQDHTEISFLKEKIASQAQEIASQKTKISALEMAFASQDKRIVILGTPDETQSLKKEITGQNTKIASLESVIVSQDEELASLRAAHEKEVERLALEAAQDRQRVTKLEQKKPQPLQKDRGDILRALIAASGGKVLAKYARLKMHLDKATFSRLLSTLSDYVTRKVYQADRRQRLLVLNNS